MILRVTTRSFCPPLHLYSNDAVDFCGTNHNILLMIRLLILAAFGIAIGMFISKLLSKKRDDDVSSYHTTAKSVYSLMLLVTF